MHQKTLFLGIASLFALFLATATVTSPINAHADFGPKPTTIVKIEGMEAVDSYYVAPLAKNDFGPSQVVTSIDQLDEHDTPTATDEKMLTYTDVDGYLYTTMRYYECEGNQTVRWGYYPPNPFKVLFYIPGSEAFVATPALERTTFDSYFTLRLSGEDYLALAPNSVTVIEEASISNVYHVVPQIFGIIARMLITLMIELGIAWLFKYRSKKQLLAILLANVVTQLGLNIGLNLFYLFNGGGFVYWIIFFAMELVVFIAEAVFYKIFFTLKEEKDPLNYRAQWAVVYALAANALSMSIGILLSYFWSFGLF